MNGTDKYNKDHLNDPKNRKNLEHYRGYFIDKVYRKICYKNKNKVWMYARSVDTKPGFVYIYSHGQLVSVNERAIAHAILGPYIPKPVPDKNAEITRVLDKRYKPNTDTGTMSTQKIEAIKAPKIKKVKEQPIFNKARRLQSMFDQI
jgi:hypothetical protein